MKRIPLFILSLLLLLAAGWAPPPQGGEVVVTGQVTNETPGGTLPAGQPVTLHVLSGMETMETYTTTLSSEGAFRFEDLTLEPDTTLVARVRYQDVAYLSEFVTYDPGGEEPALPVTVYETTDDPSGVVITQLHFFLVVEGDRLQVSEYYLVSNRSERTFVGTQDAEAGRRTTLSFQLPEGAENLRFDSGVLGERFVERAGGFADTRPIPPGMTTSEILFTYELPYREGMELDRTPDVGVSSVVLLLAEGGMALEGGQLEAAGTMETQMGPAVSYTAGPLEAGESLVFAVTGQPQASQPMGGAPAGGAPVTPPSGGPSTAQEVGVGLAALAASLVGVYLLWRTPGPGPLPAAARPAIAAIAELDEDFRAGGVEERDYHEQRRALKAQARAILRKSGDRGPRAG